MAVYTGEIKSFQPNGNKIVVGSLKLHLSPYLFVTVAKNFRIGDRVLVEYLDGEVKSVVKKGTIDE